MAKVTALVRLPGERALVEVHVDGRKLLTVPEAAVEALGLAVGAAFGGSAEGGEGSAGARRAPEGPAADERRAARESALRLLSVRARSKRELSDRLRRKGHDASLVAEVVDALAAVGLVDDRAFAGLWVDERVRRRPLGRRRLAQELRAKGVDAETVEEVLSRAFLETSEKELALRVARSFAGRGGSGPRARERVYAALVRRGFSYATAADAVREVMGERDD